MELFRKCLSKFGLSDTEIVAIISVFTCVRAEKGQKVFHRGHVCNEYFFLEAGLLRFVHKEKEKEETSWVIFEGVFFSELVSLKSREKSQMDLEAIEVSVVYRISEKSLNELCDRFVLFERFLRYTWEENLYQMLQMKLLQQFSSARERYDSLIRDSRLTQRIPQKYLASILGITEFSLSRLRRQK